MGHFPSVKRTEVEEQLELANKAVSDGSTNAEFAHGVAAAIEWILGDRIPPIDKPAEEAPAQS